MRDLRRYRSKRDPDRTPEPFGLEDAPARRGLPPGASRRFAVQQHAARSLHWDLRLEIDGVLVSWAIPKGPSLDPADKRLAVRTEDHPLAYGDFEGVIPQGNYGAGAMVLWDRGTYRSVDGVAPAEGLETGKLDLALSGHKLSGRFALVRTRGESGKEWLLLRKGAPPAEQGSILERAPASVVSGLTVEQLRDGVSHTEELAALADAAGAARRRVDVAGLRPMLAHTEDAAFSRDGWLFELKYDGVRTFAAKSADGGVRLQARAGGDRTRVYPEIALAMAHLPVDDCVLDGEVVALDEAGRSSFERLQRRFTQTDPEAIELSQLEVPVVYQVFDLLSVAGRDLRKLPLGERKRILSALAPGLGYLRFAEHVEGDGEALFAAARQHELEGVVAKRAASPYQAGRRSRHWLKIKVPRTAHLVIVGVVRGKGGREALGSLMLAWQKGGGLHYAGNVGSGLGEAAIASLLEVLEPDRIDAPAFEGTPAPSPRGSWYVAPRLVCDVRYTEVTSAGNLRHPVFLELCPDVAVEDCVAPGERGAAEPEPVSPPRQPAKLELSNLEKVFWPVEGYTKRDLLGYYQAVWPWLGPYLRDRPVVLTRYPDGIEGKSFYQKNAPEFTPEWAVRESIDGTDYFICNDLRTLLYVINSGAIPLHVWHSRITDLEHPDWLILDLDPKDAPFGHVVVIARHLHRLLDELGASHFAKTSGQDGLHVLLPLGGALDHGEAKLLGEVLARVVCAELPEIATVTRPVAARGDKVYVDFLQNGRGKLIAAPFSVRPRPHATVSTPLTWAQVTKRLDPTRWTIETTPKRIERSGDPMAGLLGGPVDVELLLSVLAERLATAGDG